MKYKTYAGRNNRINITIDWDNKKLHGEPIKSLA